jgi:hypothetical protein
MSDQTSQPSAAEKKRQAKIEKMLKAEAEKFFFEVTYPKDYKGAAQRTVHLPGGVVSPFNSFQTDAGAHDFPRAICQMTALQAADVEASGLAVKKITEKQANDPAKKSARELRQLLFAKGVAFESDADHEALVALAKKSD